MKNEKIRCVEVTWNHACLGDDEERVTNEKLLPTKYNPKEKKERAWRQYSMK